MDRKLTVGSLFSGIGGFDLGLERAGMHIAWQCEADEFCQRVLSRHWPGVPCYPDIRQVRGLPVGPVRSGSEVLADSVDVLCGGFPCQDISLAGRAAGINGARSGLWGEYARLIGELRPRYVLVENVAALLTRGLGRVLGDLAALGYDAEWDCLPASAFGAPHRRDRIWIVAYPESELVRSGLRKSEPREVWRRRSSDGGGSFDGANPNGGGRQERRECDREQAEPGLEASQRSDVDGLRSDVAHSDGQGSQGRGSEHELSEAGCSVDVGRSGWWAVEPDVGRVAHGVPARVDRLRSLGNALVPQIAEWLGRQILDYERRAA